MFNVSTRRWFWGLVGGIVLGGIAMMVTGSSKSIIQINYAMYPEVLDGCDVLIDGEVAGQLTPIGANYLTGFRVDDGRHTIAIDHAEIACEPVTIESGYGGHQVMLLADIGDRHGEPSIMLDF